MGKRKPPFRPDPDFASMESTANDVMERQIRTFVRIVHEKQQEIKHLRDDIAAEKAGMKAHGYDTRVLMRLVEVLKKDPEAVREQEDIFALYREAYERSTPAPGEDDDEPSLFDSGVGTVIRLSPQ